MRLYSLQSVLRSFVLLHFVVQVHAQSSDTEKQWFFPALPSQNVSSATSGQTIILRWSTSVQDLFDHYPDSLNADLWIAEGIFYQYRRLISAGIDTSEGRSPEWEVDLDYDWLVAVPLWYFALVENGVRPNWKHGILSPPIVLKPSSSTATTTKTQPTCTSAPSSTITASSTSTASFSSGAKAGIAAGSVAAACLMFATGFLFAVLKSRKKDDTDEIVRPPTPSLRPPPALASRQNIDKISLRSGHPAQPALAGLDVGSGEDAPKRLNLSLETSSQDGTTIGPPIEMPGT